MVQYILLCGLMYTVVGAELPTNGIKPTNILGGPQQHASFSFIRPGLTQTSYAFNGPSSHQTFSSTIGNPPLTHRISPNVAQILTYRNPGLVFPAHAASQYAGGSTAFSYPEGINFDQSSLHQFQHGQQLDAYNTQLGELLTLRNAQLLQMQAHQGQAQLPGHQSQTSDQIHLQQQQQQNLLGVAYSPATSVAHVKASGYGYKYNF